MYSKATPSPLDPAQVVENRIVWISKRAVLNNLTWVGGWGKLQKLKKCLRNNQNNRWFCNFAFWDFSCGASVKTLSKLLLTQFQCWKFRCATLLVCHFGHRHVLHVLHVCSSDWFTIGKGCFHFDVINCQFELQGGI